MKLAGIAAAVGFMVVVQILRLGQEPTFTTERAQESFAIQVASEVKSANKAGKRRVAREDER